MALPRTRTLLAFGSLLLVAAVGAPRLTAAGEAEGQDRKAQRGRQLYVQYCISCHGSEARGDGPIGAALKTRPADLTRIATRHDERFDEGAIRDTIDGRRLVLAQGQRDMPIWGDRLGADAPTGREQAREALTASRLRLLIAYLRSIQGAAVPETTVEPTDFPRMK